METERAERFLDLYKQLEEALEEKYRNSRRHSSSVVVEFTKDYESAPVREKLETCREIRNLMTHSSNLGGEPVVIPSQPVLDALEEVLDFVRKPPLALDYATRGDQIMRAGMDHKVLKLMETMDRNGYSHIPVMKNGEFYGVFSMGSVFLYQLRNGGKALTPETTVQELAAHLCIQDHRENYAFVPRDATFLSVRRIFEKVEEKNKRVAVVFITESGRPGQKLLGMLTLWDVLRDLK